MTSHQDASDSASATPTSTLREDSYTTCKSLWVDNDNDTTTSFTYIFNHTITTAYITTFESQTSYSATTTSGTESISFCFFQKFDYDSDVGLAYSFDPDGYTRVAIFSGPTGGDFISAETFVPDPTAYETTALGHTFTVPTTLTSGLQTVSYTDGLPSMTSPYGIAYSVGSSTTEILRAVTSVTSSTSTSSSYSTWTAQPYPPPHPVSHTGAIAGGVVGGVLGLALVAAGMFFYLARRRKGTKKAQPIQEISQEK